MFPFGAVMTPIDLYVVPPSPPCRAVIIAAKYLNINVNIIYLDLMKGEQKEDWFVKLNPQHCLPTINDNGFILWESRAIMAYFANRYAPDNQIYPSNPKKRSIVDRLLQFDLNVLYRSLGDLLISIICKEQQIKSYNPQKERKVIEALDYLESILKENQYLAGDVLTLADISIYFSLEFAVEFQYDICKYKNISQWFQQMKILINQIDYQSNYGTLIMKQETNEQINNGINKSNNEAINICDDLLNLVKVSNNKMFQSTKQDPMSDSILDFQQNTN